MEQVRKHQTLSVCMIVKNEEANLGKCLQSVVEIADEIVIADTGSTDRTKEIAKSFGAIVVDYAWDHDFSGARNKSLEHATKDWILFLDADEELEKEEALKIKILINEPHPFKAYYLRLVNIIDKVDIGNAIVLRLFENGEDHRFRGKLHEQIVNCLQDKYGNDCVGNTPIRILHYGYDPAVSDAKKKSRRNLDILLTYEEKDKDGYYYYVLGNEYARIDDFDEALRIYEKAVSVTDYKRFTYIYYPYLVMNIAKVLSNAGRFDEEMRRIDELAKTIPNFKDIYFMKAMAAIECSKMTVAKEALNKYINCPQGGYEYPDSNFGATYNVPDLMHQLIKGAVRRNPELLNVYIFMTDQVKWVVDGIKSVNEIAHQVTVCVPSDQEIDVQPMKNVGAKIVYVTGPMESYVLRPTRAKYNLFLQEGEICSFVSQQRLVEELEGAEDLALTVEILHETDGWLEDSMRLVKYNKKYKTLRAYTEAAQKGDVEIEDTGIEMHTKNKKQREEMK